MPARPRPARPTVRRATLSVDLALLTPQGRALAVLLLRSPDARARDRWTLPWDAPRRSEGLDAAADRLARTTIGTTPALLEQVGALGDGRRHPGDAEVSVGYYGLVPAPMAVGEAARPDVGGAAWWPVAELPGLSPRQRALVDAAFDAVRARVDQTPVAFRLLPATFTLSDLQEIYEILLGRRLHKASFRRALQAAFLVEPTDEWRSEGRGRPAQLFRFAPRRRRGTRRGVRFELIGA